jgi:hypothetical protein
MAGETRILKFAEGVSVGAPISTGIGATSLGVYPSQAAFVTDKGSAAAEGDAFFNSTTDKVEFYDGTSWRTVESLQNNYAAIIDPTSNDDSADGYQIGSKWLNTVANTLFIATSVGVGTATWLQVGGSFIGKKEIPAGLINGANTTYAISLTPIDDTLLVILDGLTIPNSFYSFTHPTITFNTAPRIGQNLEVFYLTVGDPAITPVTSDFEQYFHTITAGEITAKEITLPHTPIVAGETVLDVIGGCSQEYSVDYTVSGNTLSWNGLALDGVLTAGDILRVIYFY